MNSSESDKGFETRSSCPLCHGDLIIHWQEDDIPYFGAVMYITTRCSCGFRFADTMILTQKDPVRCEMSIDNLEDLNARVIRSTSGTIRVPELGIDVEPGSISDSYVTNIEGVLARIRDVVVTAVKWCEEEPEKQAAGNSIIGRIDAVLDGAGGVSVVIEDPLGNSVIIGDKAVCKTLSPEEAADLKTGMIVFDVDSSALKADTSEDGQSYESV
ncbi:zinc finger protein [Methanohalophilus levihalophilus]|uniref:ZPR1 zinc finger domain-containing protein n=1 Tax=Methanohalophilus levihalophilus TaxID=1431282 RepID=UPI001AE2C11A|nr:ZPR1 zinc finger domain-containing protein [Methanohalophilus levihalophilus]MBP2029396.1 zinc finger protein [Methanohalophilus levihalophilus]